MKRKCSACAGRGYILAKNNVHGLRIERCDACAMFDTDEPAVIRAYEDGGQPAKARQQRKPRFTVVLLYPDYATGDYGGDIYVTAVFAKDAKAAVAAARKAAYKGSSVNAAADFRSILVLAGDCHVVADATSFEGGK
jgi:hypothetical protein